MREKDTHLAEQNTLSHARRIPVRRIPQPQREGQGGGAPAGGWAFQQLSTLNFQLSTFSRLGLGAVGVRHLKNGSTTLSRPAEQGAPLPSPATRRRDKDHSTFLNFLKKGVQKP